MKLTLKIDGKDKAFRTTFISARRLKETLELLESGKLEVGELNALEETIAYVVDIFGGQFTVDQFYDGIQSNRVLPIVTELVAEIMGQANKSTEGLQDPNE